MVPDLRTPLRETSLPLDVALELHGLRDDTPITLGKRGECAAQRDDGLDVGVRPSEQVRDGPTLPCSRNPHRAVTVLRW
jgi:hypothetical protein